MGLWFHDLISSVPTVRLILRATFGLSLELTSEAAPLF